MFNPRGGFPGQGMRPHMQPRMNQPGMNASGMNQPAMGLSSMNQPGMGFSGMNQTGMGISGMGISGMNQQGMGLSGMNQQVMGLSGMNKQGMGLSGMNKQGMGLSGMNKQGTGLSGMNKQGTGLSGMNKQGMGLSGMNKQGMGLSGMNKQGMGLSGMNKQGMGLSGMNKQGMGLSGMNKQGMGLSGMNQQGMGLSGMNQQGMGLSGTNQQGMGLSGTNQQGMGLSGTNQQGMGPSGMNQQGMGPSGMNQQGMGPSGMNQQGMGPSGMNQQGMGPSGMGPSGMNQQGMGPSGMGPSGMNQQGLNQQGMGLSGMNQQGLNQQGMGLSGMNHQGMNQQGMGLPGMNQQGMGLSGMNRSGNLSGGIGHAGGGPPAMNQSGMNLNRMNQSGMNQGGMGFNAEIRNPGVGPRPRGIEPQGSFTGNPDPVGMKNMPNRPPVHATPERGLGPQAFQKRFVGSCPTPRPVQPPRIQSQAPDSGSLGNIMPKPSPSDLMMDKTKPPLQEPSHFAKEKLWESPGTFGKLSQGTGMKQTPGQPIDLLSEKRYSNESASSILESFGLSNEDLEELSRYPDDQLTPANMPVILRDIRMRKVGRSGASSDQGGGTRRSGGEVLPSKVIDYGHSSKFQFEDPVRSYGSQRTEHKPDNTSSKVEPKKVSVSKEPATPANASSLKSNDKPMENKIPTLLNPRKNKASWPGSKVDRSLNNPASGQALENNPADASSSEQKVRAVVPPDLPDVVGHAEPQKDAQRGSLGYQAPLETPSPASGSWTPSLSQADTQKSRMPTPSMMNDYYAASPRLFPHICSLCNVECGHLKDWIKHQNTPGHIECCRKLRQQYPQWNPHVLAPIRSDDNKSDEGSSKRSRSRSLSPRRSRGSGARIRPCRTRSKSPRSSGRIRSKSRSPRRPRRSPRRSRSPRRRSRSPRRSLSPKRNRRARTPRTSSTTPDKKAVDAAVASFIESTKAKSGDKKPARPSSNGRKASPKSSTSKAKDKKPESSTAPPKKTSTGGGTARKAGSVSSVSSSKKSSSSSSAKKPTSSTWRKTSTSSSTSKRPSASSSSTRKPLSSSLSARRPSVRSATDRKVSGSVAKVTSGVKKPLQSKKTPAPADPKASSVDVFNPVHKFKNKTNSGTIIHVTNLPDSDYTDQDIMKIVQPFGKVSDILIIRSKNEAYLQTNFKEAAVAAVEFSETVPVMVNNTRVKLCLAGQKKEPGVADVKVEEEEMLTHEDQNLTCEEEKPTQEEDNKPSLKKKPLPEVIPPGFIKTYKLAEPTFQNTEKCVIEVSNLPEGQPGVEEISNLAKPFGGVVDIIFVSTHRKVYLQLSNKSSADSMIKFYSAFPTFISGNSLTVAVNPKFKDLKDEDRIFAEIVEQSPYQIKPTIYERFVHLSNLPEKGYAEFEVVCIGLRFGKVEHYAIFANKRKAILHMCTVNAAKSMHSFLSQYPCSIKDCVVNCSLSTKTEMAEDEYVATLEPEKKSCEAEGNPDETEIAQTADDEAVKGPVEATSSAAKTSTNPDTPTASASSAPNEAVPPAVKPTETTPAAKDDAQVMLSMATSPISGSDLDDVAVRESPVELHEMQASVHAESERTELTEQALHEQNDDSEMEEQISDTALDILGATAMAEDEDDVNDEEYDEEEAAEAPEAPAATVAVCFHTESMVPVEDTEPVVEVKVPESEELEVMVSVESEEEEDDQHMGFMGSAFYKRFRLQSAVPVASVLDEVGDTACDENEDLVGVTVDPEADEDETLESSEPTKALNDGAKMESDGLEHPEQSKEVPVISEPPSNQEETHKKVINEDLSVTNTEPANLTEKGEEATEKEERPEDVPMSVSAKKSKDARQSEMSTKESGDTKSDSPLKRTAKYNPHKGEISVTVTLDSQKSKSDVRKRQSAESRSSGRESSTPKSSSSSSRTSPTDTSPSNPKSSASSQKKATGKGTPSQQDRESKAASKSWERETRSNVRKDDRSKNLPPKYPRSSKGSSRGSKSNEDQESDKFPFDLEEFVTVDEIVEEQTDTQRSKTPPAAGAGKKEKRKEPERSPSEGKKAKGKNTTVHTASKKQSFVTLDEVGADESTLGPDSDLPQSRLTVDEAHDDKDKAFVKVSQDLMTLDEISDEEDISNVNAPDFVLTEMPEDLSKEPLLVTLDEVVEEDETSKSTPSDPEKPATKDREDKQEKDGAKESLSNVLEDHPADVTEQPLLTLDEVKGDDDAESIADIDGFNEAHQFLTVDEVGEEEEDSMTSETVAESKDNMNKKPEQSEDKSENKTDCKPAPAETTPVVTPKRGRPRKRPLVVESPPAPGDGKSKESSQKPPALENPTKQNVKTPKVEAAEKPSSSKIPATTETPTKKKKSENLPKEATKLAPFNPSTPIGMEFLVPKTGFFCELCSLFYMDDASKLKHCKSLKHYQAVEKHVAKEAASPDTKDVKAD